MTLKWRLMSVGRAKSYPPRRTIWLDAWDGGQDMVALFIPLLTKVKDATVVIQCSWSNDAQDAQEGPVEPAQPS